MFDEESRAQLQHLTEVHHVHLVSERETEDSKPNQQKKEKRREAAEDWNGSDVVWTIRSTKQPINVMTLFGKGDDLEKANTESHHVQITRVVLQA